ncbi:LOW QUALITY PROTEIN: double-stranded RNA-specific adenosine deaminase [Discoglossus pictus]
MLPTSFYQFIDSQEYNPDFLRAQREFLLGNSGLPPSNLPSWNGYRAPHRSPQKAFTSYTPLRFSQATTSTSSTGITKPSEINQILTIDKEGAVFKLSSSNPVKWTLTDKTERMLIKRRAAEIQRQKTKREARKCYKIGEADEETWHHMNLPKCLMSRPLTSDDSPRMSDEQPLTSDEPPRMSDEQPLTSDEPPRIYLNKSGPSHDPRFKIQAVLGSRRFPVAEASNKKVARKDAAAMALRILVHEEQGGTEDEVLNQLAEAPAALQDDVPSVPQTPVQIGKNPISILMEHGQKSGSMCEFVMVSQEGPPHDPKFKYLVKIGSQTFPAVVANSKKNAKLLAAETAVKLLLGESALTVDKFEAGYNSGGSDHTTIPRSLEDTGMGHGLRCGRLNSNYLNAIQFVFQAKVGGRYFPAVSASNKKQAKLKRLDAAQRVLIERQKRATITGENMGELPVSRSTFHDKIAMLSHQKFNSLTARIQNSLLGRKILAAIIMKRDSQDVGTVVSIGTGNRCVKGEELSLRGETVNDCHAEIISRRGFIRYLYSELMTFNPNNLEKSIFEETKTDLLRVKPGVTFHLYIRSVARLPCGDGALFDKSCSDQPCAYGYERHQPLFENPKQGKLRTKVENGEGTIPVESSDIVPTWDGILHGERLRTMSCSDKILRWNVLGLQGAVLTHFMEPVYLSSVTLGYLFSKGHLTRAICCRMSREGSTFEQHLQIPYYVNHPDVGRVSVYDSTRQTGKTKESSVNWCLADEDVEVLDGTKGKVDGSKLDVSRLSKMHMFLLFQALSRNRLGNHKQFSSYNEVKEAATQYQTTKGQFFKALQELGYGSWISKPQEEKSFCAE